MAGQAEQRTGCNWQPSHKPFSSTPALWPRCRTQSSLQDGDALQTPAISARGSGLNWSKSCEHAIAHLRGGSVAWGKSGTTEGLFVGDGLDTRRAADVEMPPQDCHWQHKLVGIHRQQLCGWTKTFFYPPARAVHAVRAGCDGKREENTDELNESVFKILSRKETAASLTKNNPGTRWTIKQRPSQDHLCGRLLKTFKWVHRVVKGTLKGSTAVCH